MNENLYPAPIPADLIEPGGTWLVCGGCGYNGLVTHFYFVQTPIIYEAVCNCPIEATLTA